MNVQRRPFIEAGIGLLLTHTLGRAQPGVTVRRVGILALSSEAAGAPSFAAFKQAMHDLGWLEGKTSSIDASPPTAT